MRSRCATQPEPLDQLVPQLAEHAERDHRLANNFGVEIPQFINGAAEPAQLLLENVYAERVLIRGRERFGGFDRATCAVGSLGSNSQLLTHCGMDGQIE